MVPKSVIITGASEGIGRALALSLARRGFRLGLIARRSELLERLTEVCLHEGAPHVEWGRCDVTESEALRTTLNNLDRKLDGCDVFIANAGMGGEFSIREDIGEIARKLVHLNTIATIDGIEFMKNRMIKKGAGTLAAVTSVAALRGLPSAAPLSASKAALRVYLEAIRVELKHQGVRVTEIIPGYVRTSMTANLKRPAPIIGEPDAVADVFTKAILKGRRRIIAPWQCRPIAMLLDWMPDFLYDWMAGSSAKTLT